MTETATPSAVRVAGVVFACLLGAVLIVALCAAGWIGVRGVLAYGHLRQVQVAASDIRQHLADPASAADAIAVVADDTAAARALTDDPVWSTAEGVPWVGAQLTAVSTVAAAADDVARTALAPLAEVTATFSVEALRPENGRLDVSSFADIEDVATAGAHGIDDAAAAVDDIDQTELVGPLGRAVDDVATLLTPKGGTGALARATVLLPAMLGADGPRDYLVLFQNNAEWRSLGGIPGAMALLHTDDGAIASQRKSRRPTIPCTRVGAAAGRRNGSDLWRAPRPVDAEHHTMPDFAVTGALAREMWAART